MAVTNDNKQSRVFSSGWLIGLLAISRESRKLVKTINNLTTQLQDGITDRVRIKL